MKIIYILTRIPSLDAKGDQLVYYYRIKSFLKLGYEIELVLLLLKNRINKTKLMHLKKMGVSYKVYEIYKKRIILNLLRRIYKFDFFQPFQVSIFYHPLAKKLLQEYAVYKENLILFGLLRACAIYPERIFKSGIDLIDSLTLNFYIRYKNEKNILKKLLIFIEYRLLKNYEKNMVLNSDFALIVSNIDKSFIGLNNITVLPNGVDNKKFSPSDLIISNRIIFSGNMNYKPNIEAVIWFIENCFEDLKTIIPEVKLFICGANPSKKILNYRDKFDNIFVTGKVDNLAKEIAKSSLAIAPMISGSGIQNKILEAMASGVPVVTNRKGLGDIKAQIDKEILVAENPKDFNKLICKVLNKKKFGRQIGLKGRLFILKNYNWSNQHEILNSVLNNIKSK